MSRAAASARRALAITLGVSAAAGLLLASTLLRSGVECEACLEWNGVVHCSRVSAPTRDEASDGALRNACGVLASGVTDGLACQRQHPRSLHCSD